MGPHLLQRINAAALGGSRMRLVNRKIGQSFTVNGVAITVRAIRGNRVRLCFDPPQGVLVSRAEIIEELNAAAAKALAGTSSPPALSYDR
jgi:carbon storage regulator CsrA